MPAWSTMLTKPAVESLCEKFKRGYLDAELIEKYRVLSPKLTAESFRFLQEFGWKDRVGKMGTCKQQALIRIPSSLLTSKRPACFDT